MPDSDPPPVQQGTAAAELAVPEMPSEAPQVPEVKPEPDTATPVPEEGTPETSTPLERSQSGRGRGHGRGRGRRRGGKGKAEREGTAEATEDEGTGGKQMLTRRTSNRERAKPKHYSPTQQDEETHRKRQKLQDIIDTEADGNGEEESDDDKPLNVTTLRRASAEPAAGTKKEGPASVPAGAEAPVEPAAVAADMQGVAMKEAAPLAEEEPPTQPTATEEPAAAGAPAPAAAVEQQAEEPVDQPPAAAEGSAPPTTAEAVNDADEEQEQAVAGNADPVAAGGSKAARASRRPRTTVLEESEDDAEEIPDAGAVEDRDEWQPEAHPEGGLRRSASVESEGAAEGDAKPTRKRIRKSGAGGQGKEPPKKRPTIKKGRAAALKRNKIGETAEAPADDTLKASAGNENGAQPSAEDTAAGTESTKDAAVGQPSAKAKGPATGDRTASGAAKALKAVAAKAAMAAPPKEGLTGEVAQAGQRLSAGLKELNRIYEQAQQQAQELVKQMQGEIELLDRTEMTVNLLQETGVGKTIRAISKLKTITHVTTLEQKAATVLSRWRKLSEVEGAPAPAAKAAAATPAEPKASQPARAAAQVPNPAADAKPASEPSGKPSQPAARIPEAAKPAADVKADSGAAADRSGQRQGSGAGVAVQPASAQRLVPYANGASDAIAPLDLQGAAPPAGYTGSAVRDKAILILETSFAPPPSVRPLDAALSLEEALFQRYSGAAGSSGNDPGPKYLRRLHVLWSWLAPESPAHKPQLLAKVRSGAVSPTELATMSAAEVDRLNQGPPAAELVAPNEQRQPGGPISAPAALVNQGPQPMEA